MHGGTPETKVSELLRWRDYQSRRRLLRNARPIYQTRIQAPSRDGVILEKPFVRP
jgi:hypothetical protein